MCIGNCIETCCCGWQGGWWTNGWWDWVWVWVWESGGIILCVLGAIIYTRNFFPLSLSFTPSLSPMKRNGRVGKGRVTKWNETKRSDKKKNKSQIQNVKDKGDGWMYGSIYLSLCLCVCVCVCNCKKKKNKGRNCVVCWYQSTNFVVLNFNQMDIILGPTGSRSKSKSTTAKNV